MELAHHVVEAAARPQPQADHTANGLQITISQVAALAPHVDGVVVGSALIEAIDKGEDPGAFLDGLRLAGVSA